MPSAPPESSTQNANFESTDAFDLDAPMPGEPEFEGSPFEDDGGGEPLEAVGDDEPEEQLLEAAEDEPEPEPEVDAKPEPAPKAAAVDEPPAWVIKMQERSDAQMEAFTKALARFAPKEEVEAEAPPEKFSVESVIRAGLKAQGIDPDSDDGKEIADAAGMSGARRHFGEDDHERFDKTIESATKKGRRMTATNKDRTELETLRARVDSMELSSSRSKTFALVAENLETMTETYPLAAKANKYGIKLWLDRNLEGAPDNDNLHEAVKAFDDFLSEYDTSSAVELRAAQKAFKSMKDWRSELFDGLIASAGKSVDAEPKAKLTRKLTDNKPKRPSAPRGTDGGNIDGNTDLARAIFNAQDTDTLDLLTEQSFARADSKFKAKQKQRLLN